MEKADDRVMCGARQGFKEFAVLKNLQKLCRRCTGSKLQTHLG
jgi:hypothetical protein